MMAGEEEKLMQRHLPDTADKRPLSERGALVGELKERLAETTGG